MARNRKNAKKKQNRIRSVARPSAALLALLLLLGGGTVGHTATEIGNAPTWDVTGASGDITYKAGSVHTVTTTGSSTGGGLQALEITVTTADSGGRQLILTGNTTFNNTATLNGYDMSGTPWYARVDINSGVTMSVVNGTTLTNTSQLNITGTHAGDITVMGIDSHVNLAGTQQGNVTLYGYDAVNSTLASATGGVGTPTVTGNVNVRLGLVQVQNANMRIQGNLELYGHLFAGRVVVNNKNLQVDGNLNVGQNALGTGTADHSGSVTIENGASLTMLPGSSVNLKGETSGNPAILHLDGRLQGVTANVGTLTIGTGSTYGAIYVDGGTGAGSARLTVQGLTVGAGSKGYVYNKGVLEVVGSLGAIDGTLAVRDSGQIITHNASLSEASISGQGGTGLSLWNNGTWTDTGTITVKASVGAADVASQGIITAQALKATDAGGVTPAALALSTATGSQVVNLSGDGAGNFLTATGVTVAANNTLNLSGAGGISSAPLTVSGGAVNAGKGVWNFSDTGTGLVLTGGTVSVGDAAKPAEVSSLAVGKAALSGAGVVTVNANGTLNDSGSLSLANTSQLKISGGVATITGAASTADTARITVNSNGSFSAASLSTASPSGVVLNTGTLSTGSVLSSADKGLTVNGGTASLGTVSSTASNGVYLNGGTSTATSVSSSAAAGLNMQAGTLTTNTLSSTTANGATVSGGVLTVKNSLDLGAANAVLVNGTGHLTLQPASTVSGAGSITMNSATATVEGAWGTLIVSSDGSNASGTFIHEQGFLNLTQGTLLLTGLSTFTLDDLAAARKNVGDTDMGSSLLIASTGTFDSSGTKLTSIDTNFTDFALLNNGLFDTSLINGKTDGTNITINGGGAGNQNVGFKDVDLKTGGLLISQNSALTVIKDIIGAGAGKVITLDQGVLTLGNPGMSNSGGSVSTGITTTASTGNALNVTSGTFDLTGGVGHDSGGTLAVTVDKGTLNVSQTVDATTLGVINGGALNATGSITAGSLTDGFTPGKVDSGTITTQADMTVTSNGIDAVNGSTLSVAGTLTVGSGGSGGALIAAGGSSIDAATLAATGDITATGTGSHIGVTGDYVAAPTATLTATKGGDLNFQGNLSVATPLGVNAGTLEVGKNLTLSGQGLSADNGGAITVGGAVSNAGNVLADHGAAITAAGVLTAGTVTAQNGGDITAGTVSASGPVLVSGAGSTLTVATDLSTSGTDSLTVKDDAVVSAGTVSLVGVILADTNGSLTSKGAVTSKGTVTASNGGDIAVTGTLSTGGDISVSGTGSTLNVSASVDTPGSIAASAGGVAHLGSVTKAVDITANGTGSAVNVTGDVTNSGITKAYNNGTISVGGTVQSGGDITADAGILNITGAISTGGNALSANNGMIHGQSLTALNVSATTGGDIMLDKGLTAHGTVLVDGAGSTLGAAQGAAVDGSLTVSTKGRGDLMGDSSAQGVTVSSGGALTVTGQLSSTGSVTVDGAGSSLGVTGALNAAGQDMSVTGGAQAEAGSVTAKNVTVSGAASTLLAHGTITASGTVLVDGGTATITGTTSLADTARLTVDNGGSFSTASLTAGSPGGVVLNSGTLSTGSVLSNADKGLSVNGGTASLGAVTSTVANGVYLSGGASTATSVSSSAAGGLNMQGGTLITNTLSSNTASGVTVGGGVLTVKNSLTLGAANAVLVNGTGHLTLQPSVTLSGAGSITMNSATATLEGAWARLIASSDGSFKSGTFTHENALLNLTKGTLLLTGLSTYTLNDLSMARKNASDVDVGAALLIASTGTLQSSGTPVDSISTDFPGFGSLNNGLFDITLVNAKTDGTDVTINGGGAGNQNVGFKDVDLNSGGLTVSKDSALTVITGITDAGPGKAITLDQGVLTLGNPGMSNSGGSISTGITTTASTGNALNVTNGTFDLTGSVGHDPAGTLDVLVDKGTLNVSQSVDATTLAVTNTGALTTTGSLNTGSLTAQSGGDITAASLTATGPVLVDGAGSTLAVSGAVTAPGQSVSVTGGAQGHMGSLTAQDVSVSGAGTPPALPSFQPSSLQIQGDATASGQVNVDTGSLSLGGSLNTGGDVTLSKAGSLTTGKNVTATGNVSLNAGSGLTAGGQLTAKGVTATGLSTVTAASATLSGPVSLHDGSALTVTGNFATSGTGQTINVGAATDTQGSSLMAGSHEGGNAAAYFVASGAAGSPSALRFGSVGSPLNDSVVAGPNSLVSVGPRNLTWVTDQITASGVTPSATLALSTPISLGSTGQWLAGEKYTAGGQWNGAATADNYGLALRGSSLLITDLSTAGAGPVLTLGGRNTALVEPGVSIRVYADKLHAGQSYALVGGLATGHGLTQSVTQDGSTWLTNGQALKLHSLSSSNALITVSSVTLAGDRLLFNTQPVDAGQTLPEVSDSLADYLNNMSLHFGFDTQSANAGVRFLSRALDSRFGGGDLSHASRVMEGAQQLAVAGGVQGSTLSAVQGTVDAFSGRTSLASPLMRPTAGRNGMTGLRLDDNGSVAPDEGLSGGVDEGVRNGVAVWAMPIYQHNSVSGMTAGNMRTGFNSNLGGLALGADYTFDNMFRLGVALGLGGGYAQSTGDFNQTDNSFNFWSAHVYGGWNVRNFGLTAHVGYSGNYNKVQQSVDSNMGMANLHSDVNSTAFSAGLRGEYKFETSLMDIIPHVGVRYTGLSVDGYDVKSGGTVFSVESNTQNIWTFPLGVTFSKSMESASGWVFRPQLDLGITPATGDVKARSRARVPGVDGVVSLQGQVVDYMSYDAGLGFEVQKGALTLGINYQIQASEHRTAQGVFGMFRYEF